MAFTRPETDSPKRAKVRVRVGRAAGTVGVALLLWLAALLPYDRLTPEPQGSSDLVPLGPSDPPVHSVADLSRLYGISPAAEAHFRVDASGIHNLRKATPDDEEHR